VSVPIKQPTAGESARGAANRGDRHASNQEGSREGDGFHVLACFPRCAARQYQHGAVLWRDVAEGQIRLDANTANSEHGRAL